MTVNRAALKDNTVIAGLLFPGILLLIPRQRRVLSFNLRGLAPIISAGSGVDLKIIKISTIIMISLAAKRRKPDQAENGPGLKVAG